MTQTTQHRHKRLSTRQFTGARVFHQYRTTFDASLMVPRLVPRFPTDYYRYPVAFVDTEDLGTIFRLTQRSNVLPMSELDLVHWDRRATRSTSYGDVIVLDYGLCHEAYRVECGSFRSLVCNVRATAV